MSTQPSSQSLSRAGLIGLVTGIIGAASAVVLLALPREGLTGRLSYPFSPTGFLFAQGFFFVHHWGLVVLCVALALSGAWGRSRWGRWGFWLAVVGMLGLTFAELNTMRFGEMDAEQANKGFVGATYGISCNLIGLGMLIAGVAVLRARVWSGWRRWMPLVIGIATFVELTPGMFGGWAIARIAIGVWLLLFGVLGQSLRAEALQTAAAS